MQPVTQETDSVQGLHGPDRMSSGACQLGCLTEPWSAPVNTAEEAEAGAGGGKFIYRSSAPAAAEAISAYSRSVAACR
jgi:hypothetical protein